MNKLFKFYWQLVNLNISCLRVSSLVFDSQILFNVFSHSFHAIINRQVSSLQTVQKSLQVIFAYLNYPIFTEDKFWYSSKFAKPKIRPGLNFNSSCFYFILIPIQLWRTDTLNFTENYSSITAVKNCMLRKGYEEPFII